MSKNRDRYKDEDNEVRRQDAIREESKSKGKPADNRNLTERGEAITRRADFKDAADQED